MLILIFNRNSILHFYRDIIIIINITIVVILLITFFINK